MASLGHNELSNAQGGFTVFLLLQISLITYEYGSEIMYIYFIIEAIAKRASTRSIQSWQS